MKLLWINLWVAYFSMKKRRGYWSLSCAWIKVSKLCTTLYKILLIYLSHLLGRYNTNCSAQNLELSYFEENRRIETFLLKVKAPMWDQFQCHTLFMEITKKKENCSTGDGMKLRRLLPSSPPLPHLTEVEMSLNL